jgi:hypothetical protein
MSRRNMKDQVRYNKTYRLKVKRERTLLKMENDIYKLKTSVANQKCLALGYFYFDFFSFLKTISYLPNSEALVGTVIKNCVVQAPLTPDTLTNVDLAVNVFETLVSTIQDNPYLTDLLNSKNLSRQRDLINEHKDRFLKVLKEEADVARYEENLANEKKQVFL